MLKSLERNIASVHERIVFLAPSVASVDEVFANVTVDSTEHDRLVQQVQRMRGRIYLNDGAIDAGQLTAEGLHRTSEDEQGWHMLLLNGEQQVAACALYVDH